MRITHTLLQQWLVDSHTRVKRQVNASSPWPLQSTQQSDWTLWAHHTLALAMRGIYPISKTIKMSLRVSQTKKDPSLWTHAVTWGVVNDYTTQQQGIDFCLMGPSGARVHHLTAESECSPRDSVSISLSEQGYIWDWSKLLHDLSEHRLFFAVVGGDSRLPAGDVGHPEARRLKLTQNMIEYFRKSHGGIQFPEGIGGYILAHHHAQRADSYTFIVDDLGNVDFQQIPTF